MPALVPSMSKVAHIGCVTTSRGPGIPASWAVWTQATSVSCSTFSLFPKYSKGQGYSLVIYEENHSSSYGIAAQRGETNCSLYLCL